MLTVQVDAHKVAVGLVSGELWAGCLRELQRILGRLVQVVLPELPEVLRLLGVGHYLLGREANLHVVLVGGAVELHRQADVAEARFLRCPRLDDGAPVLQRDGALRVGLHQVVADSILHHAVARYAVFIELHLDGSLLARLVEPVGMVGNGHPQVVAAIGIIFCIQAGKPQ